MTKQANVITTASATAQELYRRLLTTLDSIGPFEVEPKKTSVHLVRRSAFAGVQFRRECIILTIKSEKPIKSERVIAADQPSANRWHSEIRITTGGDIDRQLLGWLKAAFDLCA